MTATVIAGYYSANGQLYRFAAAELAAPDFREKAVSLVLAGGLVGAVLGPNLASRTRNLLEVPFAGAYLSLAAWWRCCRWSSWPSCGFRRCRPRRPPPTPAGPLRRDRAPARSSSWRPSGAALGYGVMNLLMAATPLAMQVCGFAFDDAALVLEWHVIGMFAPGFFTGHLIKRFGTLTIMGVGVALNLACIAIALTGVDLHQFLIALFLLGVGWNFLFTGSTTLSLQAYRPEEKDRAQAAINFFVFATMAVTSFASGALVTTQGWALAQPGLAGAGGADRPWRCCGLRGSAPGAHNASLNRCQAAPVPD